MVSKLGNNNSINQSGWPLVRLGDYLTERGPKNRNGFDLPVYSVSNQYGFVLSDEFFNSRVYSKETSTYKIVQQGDLAYNPYRINVGSIGLQNLDQPSVLVSPAYVVFTTTGQLLPEYLWFLMKSPEFNLEIKRIAMSRGSVRRSLSFRDLADFQILLPEIKEQKAILNKLRLAIGAIETCERVIVAASHLKQSLLHHLLKYGLTTFGNTDEVGLVITEAGELPVSWSLISLGEIAELIQYGTSSRCADNMDSTPVIRIPNVIGGVIDSTDLKYLNATDSEIDRFQLKEGDILFVRTNGQKRYVGRSAVYQGEPNGALFASYLIRVRVDKSQAIPEFLNIYVETAQGKKMLSGRAINSADGKYNINTQTIRDVMVPIPSLSEQRGIIEQVMILINKLNCEGKRLESLQIIFKSLLHHLMTGKVRLPEFINNGSTQ